jgi:hypothetical protein
MSNQVDYETRVKNALDMAQWGSFDGAHHKMWAIDQIVRALTGCTRHDDSMGTDSREYQQWVAEFEMGEDGPHTYEWDTGIAP